MHARIGCSRELNVVRGCTHHARPYALVCILLHAHGNGKGVKKEFVDIEYRAHRGHGDQRPSRSRGTYFQSDPDRVAIMAKRRPPQAWIAASKPALVQPEPPIVDKKTLHHGPLLITNSTMMLTSHFAGPVLPSPRSPCFY